MVTFLVKVKFCGELPEEENGNYSVEKLGKIVTFQLKKNGASNSDLKVLIAGNQLVIKVADKDVQLVEGLLVFVAQNANLIEKPRKVTAGEAEEILRQDSQKTDSGGEGGKEEEIHDQLKREIRAEYAIYLQGGDQRLFSEIQEIYSLVVNRLRVKFPEDDIYVSGEGERNAIFALVSLKHVRAFEREAGRERQSYGLAIRRISV